MTYLKTESNDVGRALATTRAINHLPGAVSNQSVIFQTRFGCVGRDEQVAKVILFVHLTLAPGPANAL